MLAFSQYLKPSGMSGRVDGPALNLSIGYKFAPPHAAAAQTSSARPAFHRFAGVKRLNANAGSANVRFRLALSDGQYYVQVIATGTAAMFSSSTFGHSSQ